jgi:hypothetical protein
METATIAQQNNSMPPSGFERFVAEGGMPGAKQATLRRLMRTASL